MTRLPCKETLYASMHCRRRPNAPTPRRLRAGKLRPAPVVMRLLWIPGKHASVGCCPTDPYCRRSLHLLNFFGQSRMLDLTTTMYRRVRYSDVSIIGRNMLFHRIPCVLQTEEGSIGRRSFNYLLIQKLYSLYILFAIATAGTSIQVRKHHEPGVTAG